MENRKMENTIFIFEESAASEIQLTEENPILSVDTSEPVVSITTGLQGENGKGLEFNWDGTRLGVRQEGSPEFDYVDLKGDPGEIGPQGETGPQGQTGSIQAGDGSAITAAFSAASGREELISGENLSVLFGKLKKFYTLTPETLTANRIYYVNATSGNDQNDGLTAVSPFKTLATAFRVAYGLDTRAFNVTIDLCSEVYSMTSKLIVSGLSGSGVLTIRNGTICNSGGGSVLTASGYRCNLKIHDLTLISSYDTSHQSEGGILTADQGAQVEIQNATLDFQSASSVYSFGAYLYAKRNSKIYLNNGSVTFNNTIGKKVSFLLRAAYMASLIMEYNTVTIILNAAFDTETYFASGFAFGFLDIQSHTRVENIAYTRRLYQLAYLSFLRYQAFLPSGGSGTSIAGNSIVL